MYTCDTCGEVLKGHAYAEPYGMFCDVECRHKYEVDNDEVRQLWEGTRPKPASVD